MRIENQAVISHQEMLLGGLPQELIYEPSRFNSYEEFEQLERAYTRFLIQNKLIETIPHKVAMKEIAKEFGFDSPYFNK